MKILVMLLFVGFSFLSRADQLAYISKQEATEAAARIAKMNHIYLFCGCCSVEKPLKVKVKSAIAQYTGYENYYEVILTYMDEDGELHSEGIDLAYVWKKSWGRYKTVGELMKMEHDPCVNPRNWNAAKE